MKYISGGILLLFLSCESKVVKKDSQEEKPIEKTKPEKPKTFEIGFYETFEKLPKLVLLKSTKEEFDAIRYANDFDSIKEEPEGDFFILTTKHQKHQFKKYKDDGPELGHNGVSYEAFSKNLGMHALVDASSSEGLGFAELILLDDENDNKYEIISMGDWAVSLPLTSPNRGYMVYYQNVEYESKLLTIAVLKINSRKNPANLLKEYKSVEINEGLIVETVKWKNNEEIVFKMYLHDGFDENGKEKKVYEYRKVDIKN